MLISQQDFPSIKLPKTLQWAYPLIDQISKKLNPSLNHENNFPCIFARRVFSLLNFRFLTINWCKDQHTYDFKSFANELSSFLEETQQSDENINNIEPLIVLFEPVKFIFSTHHYEKYFLIRFNIL
nr:YqcI/YcgG family protein [Thiothrix subterranea]